MTFLRVILKILQSSSCKIKSNAVCDVWHSSNTLINRMESVPQVPSHFFSFHNQLEINFNNWITLSVQQMRG